MPLVMLSLGVYGFIKFFVSLAFQLLSWVRRKAEPVVRILNYRDARDAQIAMLEHRLELAERQNAHLVEMCGGLWRRDWALRGEALMQSTSMALRPLVVMAIVGVCIGGSLGFFAGHDETVMPVDASVDTPTIDVPRPDLGLSGVWASLNLDAGSTILNCPEWWACCPH